MLFVPAMPDERATLALSRIERSLGRIEAAAQKLQQPAPRDDGELRELRQVHQALRGKVEDAISQIDRLLSTGERP
jgi:hypothetical protein